MPISQKIIPDGHENMVGVDTTSDPSELPGSVATRAVNRRFRGSVNRTRPIFQGKTLVFESEELENEFRHGNIQASIGYNRFFKNTSPHIVVAVGGMVLKGRVYGDTISFSKLWDLSTPEYRHGWFVQSYDRLYFQNQVDDPRGWDGTRPAYIIEGGIENDKMPIGNLMASIHGRTVVFSANNHASVSDYMYSGGLRTTRGQENFIEIQQYNDLGAIASPAQLGDIAGAIAVPRQPDKNGQGELLVLCEDGAYTLDLSSRRDEWWLNDIQQTVMTGVGAAGDKCVVAANNDIWFRTATGGISSYKFERSESEREWGDTSLSREVDEFLQYDSPANLVFCSAAKCYNRLLVSCAITIKSNDIDGYGQHHFGQGMVALDFDRGSTVNRKPGFAWDGLWTGVNPVDFVPLKVDGARRTFVLSHDDDGQNRIYEVMPDEYRGSDMADGLKKAIVGFYDTTYLFRQKDPTKASVTKKIVGSRFEVSKIRGSAKLSAEYRPDFYPCFFDLSKEVEIGCSEECEDTDGPDDIGDFHARFNMGLEERGSKQQGSFKRSESAEFFTIRVHTEGDIAVNKAQFYAEMQREDESPFCTNSDDLNFCELIKCCDGGYFRYKIVDGPEPDPVDCEGD